MGGTPPPLTENNSAQKNLAELGVPPLSGKNPLSIFDGVLKQFVLVPIGKIYTWLNFFTQPAVVMVLKVIKSGCALTSLLALVIKVASVTN